MHKLNSCLCKILFPEKSFGFPENVSTSIAKTFKISIDCYIKPCQSLKWSTILKTPSSIF